MASRLADIGIRSLEDLLFHFPLRYQDRTKITAIGGLRDQIDAVVEAEVRAAAVTMGRRRTLLIKVDDGTGLLTLRFFHFRQAQVSQFKQGSTIQLFGTPRWLGGQIEMVHPEYRLGEGEQLLEAALTPVYPTVSGLGQSTWRKLCGQALALLSKDPPEDLLDGITDDDVSLTEAIAFLHNPPPTAELNQIQQGTHPAQIRLALNLIRIYAVLSAPFIPTAAARVCADMNTLDMAWPTDIRTALTALPEGHGFNVPDVLFAKITDDQVAEWSERFAGTRD